MIYDTKLGKVYIFNKNNGFLLTNNKISKLDIFIKELKLYVNITNPIFISKDDINYFICYMKSKYIKCIFNNYIYFLNNNVYDKFNILPSINNEDKILKLYNDNIKLVYWVIHKYFYKYQNTSKYDDICQEGFIALYKACLNFKEDKNNTFSTFAISYILNTIKKFLYYDFSLIRIPRSIYYNKNREDINDFNKKSNILSLNIMFSDKSNENDSELSNFIYDEKFNNEEDYIILKNDINKIINKLKDKHKQIFTLYLSGEKQLDICKKTKLSQPQVSRVIRDVKKIITNYLKDEVN